MNQHIECHSYITGRDVKYTLIGAKLKHRLLQEDWGCKTTRDAWNTSPWLSPSINPTLDMYVATGCNDYPEGELEAIYENYNVGKNPIIAASTYNVNDFEVGINTRELFETDAVKIELAIEVRKMSESLNGYRVVGNHSYENYIESVIIKYTQKGTSSSLGTTRLVNKHGSTYPITFSINTELWCIKDFDPRYKMEHCDSDYSDSLNGLHVDGGPKITNKVDFVGASFSVLCSEVWEPIYVESSRSTEYHICKIVKDGNTISNNELRRLVNGVDIKYIRDKIETEPNKFMQLIDISGGFYKGRCNWANDNLNTEGYVMESDTNDSITSNYGNLIFNELTYVPTGILLPCVMPGTNTTATINYEGEYWSLTNNILEGPAPDEEPDEDPETVEPADNPETEYTPPRQVAFEDVPYRSSDTITGLELNYNLFRPSYSNYIFPKYYRDSIEGDSDWESAITFIQEACNPSAFEAWGAAFKLITGHPTPGEIISRVYYLPFEYEEIRGDNSAGFYFSAPVYGPVGPVTLGVKTHSEDPSNTGKPIESNIHYYQQIVNRFKTINLGQVTIKRVYNNFLDYSDVTYTLNLPYGAGQVELDPDLLFKDDIGIGNIKLTGVIDFDTGELTIIVQLTGGQRYYETTVNVAIDRLASVSDNMAAPLAIAKASMAAGAAAGGIAKLGGGGGGGISTPIPQTEDLDISNGGKYFDEHGYARDLEIERLKRKYD